MNFKNPSVKFVGITHTTIWLGLVIFFSFSFLFFESIWSINEGVTGPFHREFSKWGTFFAMIGIVLFLLFDYFVNGGAGTKVGMGKVLYPGSVFMTFLFASVASLVVYMLAVNQTNNNALDYHDIFESKVWPKCFFSVYLGSIWILRYITVHDSKMKTHTVLRPSTAKGDSLEWTEL